MKLLFIFIITFISNLFFCQISITNVADEKQKEIAPYDSLKNFLGNDYKQYKGQVFYLLPKPEYARAGYENFVIDINKSSFDNKNIFKNTTGNYSGYNDLQGKYFDVLDVIEDPISRYSDEAYLKLKIKETGDSVFFKYSKKYRRAFPFLVEGYFEKQKKIFKGNEVLIRPFPKTGSLNQKKTLDINTGVEIEIEIGKYLKCLDLTIDGKYFEPALLLENDNGQKFLFPLGARDLNISRVLTKQESENYRTRFGDEYWHIILNENVKIGFTEEMTLISIGKPDKINKSSNGDQWVYNDKYLYFENGKLKAFN